MSRIAIVIGVNQPQGLTPLQGAVSDAKAFGDWIAAQGFEVKSFTDDIGAVTLTAVFNELQRIVASRTYTQVVIYFAGHGFQREGSEVWLLSGAPINAAEAISVYASVMASRESGLKSVVMISDACRSIPSGLQNSRVDGNAIFPNQALNRRPRPEVDLLYATLPSLVAVEAANANDAARRGGVFTHELMSRYQDPPASFIDKISEGGELIEVVTNRKMKALVSEAVEDAAFAAMPQASQMPEFILESVDAYVGRVSRAPKLDIKFAFPNLDGGRLGTVLGTIKEFDIPGLDRLKRPERRRRDSPAPSVSALARQAIETAGQGQTAATVAASVQAAEQGRPIADAIQRFAARAPVERFETRTGFFVTGAAVRAASSPGFPAEVLSPELVRLQPDQPGAPSASVLIEFDGGTGTVLPGLRGYIAHVFVGDGRVVNVNYVPSTNDRRWQDYLYVQDAVEALRASVAAAASLGVFRIDVNEAQAFANRIRNLKVFDPTLGLYAAYAYAGAGLNADVMSVLDYMRSDLDAELFDVAMLARRRAYPLEAGAAGDHPVPVLPFCPMLRQGWSLLAVQEATLGDAVARARDFLLPSLWTTFAPEGVKILRHAIQRGDFQ